MSKNEPKPIPNSPQIITVEREGKPTKHTLIIHNRISATYTANLALDILKLTLASGWEHDHSIEAAIDRSIMIARRAVQRMWDEDLLQEIPNYEDLA